VTIDPRRLRPIQLVALLNSTGLGEVIGDRQLRRHRGRAGLRIAAANDPMAVDLLRYSAWLKLTLEQRRAEAAQSLASASDSYEALKERARQRNLELSLAGRDIGELPAVMNPERRTRCERNFQAFCDEYFQATFHLAWSDDHRKVIAKIEKAVLEGGLFAMAMPRGSGKTSLCETACLWALIYGHREFVALVGSDEEHASNMLDSIKAELENNERLLDDFPEVCFPIRAMEGIHQRAAGQLHGGEPTQIGWTAKEIVLPTLAGSAASGGIICVAGITGRIRGMKFKRPDGRAVRPSLVLIDDPQTDESARSPSQSHARERVLAGAILGLAGPGRKIAGLMTLTVVQRDDLADRILSKDEFAEWQGERTKMVYAFPTNEALWNEYAKLRTDGLKQDRGLKDATEFYRQHQEEMDAGARIAWPARHNPDEVSAIQHAMNLKLRDEAAFWAEYQNEPMADARIVEDLLTADQIVERINQHERGLVPLGGEVVTVFIDVQGKALFWLAAAWLEDFTGYVIDYGTEPEQREPYFTLRDLKRTLAHETPRAGLEGTIYSGLERLCDRLLGRDWACDDGAVKRADRCLIDANWGQSSDVIYQFCRQSKHRSIVMPSHGRYVGASSQPFGEYRRKPGDRLGLNWRVPRMAGGKRTVRHVVFDANYWKSFVHARFAVPVGDSGCLSLFGKKPEDHRLLAEHLTSEYRVQTQGRGRTVDEWKLRLSGVDNHWLDCLVGAAVAASMEDCAVPGTEPTKTTKRRSYADRYREWKDRVGYGPTVWRW